MLYANVIVKQRTQVSELTYALSAQIVPYVQVGSLVLVPLRRKTVLGVVVGFKKTIVREMRSNIREIIKLDKTKYVFSANQIAIIHELARYYAAPLAEVAFQALDQPQFWPEKIFKTNPIPLFVMGSVDQRWQAYEQILLRSPSRVLFVFAQHAYADSFQNYINSSSLCTVYALNDFQGKRRGEELRQLLLGSDKKIGLIGLIGDSFFPLQAGDTIVIDQPDHVGAKSQSRPFMSSKQIAKVRAQIEGLRLVYGDSVVGPAELLAVKEKRMRLVKASAASKPLTIINRKGQREPIAPAIWTDFEQAIHQNKRILVLVLARGLASALVCRNCNEVVSCFNCQRTTSVVGKLVRCNYCGKSAPIPTACLNCQQNQLEPIGEGVTSIKNLLAAHFLRTKIQELSGDQPNWDSSTQIVVATEKIFSFPDLKFDQVFIVNADRLLSGVQLDGAWQLLGYLIELQNIGGQITVQTYWPESLVWSTATGNFRAFFGAELTNRRRLRLPPFGDVVAVRGSANSVKSLQASASKISDDLLQLLPNADISELAIDGRAGTTYQGRITIYLPTKAESALKHRLAAALPKSWHLDID